MKIVNKNKIYNTQYIHSLWMRSNLETNTQSRIDIYDEILKIKPSDWNSKQRRLVKRYQERGQPSQ